MKIRITRGLDVRLAGAPEQRIHTGREVQSVALVCVDHEGLVAAPMIEHDARVRLGQPLFRDRRRPEIQYGSPASGRVLAIHRGARRCLVSVVIEVDDGLAPLEFDAYPRDELAGLPVDLVRRQMLDSGAWTSLRARPFDRVPDADGVPAAILVTAIDTNPLAADPKVVLEESGQAFVDGINVLTALCRRVYVCKAPDLTLDPFTSDRIETVDFSGGHPAGLPGTHVAHLAPVSEHRQVWHVGFQDVIALGRLFVDGHVPTERIVSIGGPATTRPRLVRTRLGAALTELLEGEVEPDARVISGSVLSGRGVTPETAYLGRYATQVSALPEPTRSPRIGSYTNAVTTAMRGWSSGMIAVEAFERIWPFAAPVMPLLRALLVNDVDTARALGCLSLAEEDLALCSYVCPAKQDYGSALKTTLAELEAR